MPTPDWFSQLLNSELNQWIQLSDLQIGQLYQHYEMLLRWNQRMNLTTVQPGPETVIRHYCESLFFARSYSAAEKGFRSWIWVRELDFQEFRWPSSRPEWKMTLVESSKGKPFFFANPAATCKMSRY